MSTNTAASNVIAMREFDRPIPSQQAAQFDRILKECQDLACTRLSQSVSGMLDKAEEALWGLANQTQDRETRNVYLKAKDKAIAERKVIEEQFRSNYLAEIRRRAQRDKKAEDAFSKYDLSSLELGLVNDDDLNETLQTNEMAGKLRRYCEEELIALDQRVGVLVGDATLQGDGNPFSPHAICNAYKLACKHLELELKVLTVFLKLFDDHVLDDIRSIYKDLNGLLVQRSILPKIRYSVGKSNGTAAGGSASAAVLGALLSGVAGGGTVEAGAGTHGAGAGPSGDQDLFSVLQNLLTMNVRGATSGAPGAGLTAAPSPGTPGSPGNGAAQVPGFPQIFGAPAGGANPLQGAALLGSLTRIQHGDVSGVAAGNVPLAATLIDPGTINVLRELKATSLGTGLGQVDAMTLDIVAMLFDHIFDDRKIPGAMKGLIGRLQIPILKVAIVDKTFFSKKSHPARILLDTLGEFAVGLNADFDHTNALYQSLEKAVQKLIDGFTDSVEIFETTQAEVSRLIAQENARVEEETRRAAKRIEEKESLAVAKAIAQDEIKHRAGTQQMPQAVLKFLTAQWVKLLLVAYAKHGKDSDAWKSALETMDLLIWSVNSKQVLEERRKLASLLPGLLKRLNAGMQMIGVESEIRTRFFAKLMKCHTRVMSGAATIVLKPAATSKAAKPAAQASTVPVAKVPTSPLARTLTEPPILTELAPPALPSLPSLESSKLASDGDEATPSEPTTMQTPPEVDDTEVAADAPEFSPVTIQNPFGGGEIEVEEISLSDIPLTPGMPQDGHPTTASASGDEHSHMASTLKEGDWVEFRDQDDNRRQAKLSYISPLKGTYLFVNRQGKTVGEFSLYQLAREFRSGNLSMMDEVPLFDRAMSSLVGALRGSATTH